MSKRYLQSDLKFGITDAMIEAVKNVINPKSNKSIDGEESGSREEKDEKPKINRMKKTEHMKEAAINKAFEVGDRVKIDAPGFASHGHEGTVTKIHPDGRHEVDLGGFKTGTQSRITTQSGLLGRPGETFQIPPKTMGGTKTTVEPSALRRIKESVEQIDELGTQTYYNASDKAARKAEELRNTDTSTGHSAADEYERQARKFKEKAVRSELPKSKQRKINYEEVEFSEAEIARIEAIAKSI